MIDQELIITCPDDWHLHLRDNEFLPLTVGDAAASFARAVIMPNLEVPVTTVALARAYRQRILREIPDAFDFTPLMTLYLTEEVSAQDLRLAAKDPDMIGCKLYPANVTTHSAAGVSQIKSLYPQFEVMQEVDLPLLIHGEVSDPEVDVFDREKVFIERELIDIRRNFPGLRTVLEHITTKDSVDFVSDNSDTLAATITAHHLAYDRNVMLADGIRPHYYCKPLLKRKEHRSALIAAATSGKPCFFAGTDSAPHRSTDKESACGCAGCYSMPVAMAIYANEFEKVGKLEQLEGFCAFHGADFYRFPYNQNKMKLTRRPVKVPQNISRNSIILVPLEAGETIPWHSMRLPAASPAIGTTT